MTASAERISPAVIGPDGLTIRQAGVEKSGPIPPEGSLSPRVIQEGLTVLGDAAFTQGDERLASELRSLGFAIPVVRLPSLLTNPRTYVMIGAAFAASN